MAGELKEDDRLRAWRLDAVKPSVGRLRVGSRDGTAWVARASPPAVLVTAAHVLGVPPGEAVDDGELPEGATLELPGRAVTVQLGGARFRTAGALDVAVIFLWPGVALAGCRPLPFSLEAPRGGEKHSLLHFPAADGKKLSVNLCAARALDDGRRLAHDALSGGGSAGGALLDAACRVVAVHVSAEAGDSETKHAVPLHAVHAALDAGGDSPWAELPATLEHCVAHEFQMPPRYPTFVGRLEYLQELDRRMQQDRTAVVSSGLAGVGKSTVVGEWAYWTAARGVYGVVAWLRAERVVEAEEDLAALGEEELGMGRRENETLAAFARRVVRSLGAGRFGAVLLVFDNADPQNHEKLQELKPRGEHCHAVYTTRDSDKFPGSMPLDSFTKREALELLERLLEREFEDDAELAEAEALVETVGRLPLAVAQVGTLARWQRKSFGEVLAQIKARESDAESLRGTVFAEYERGTAVMAAFDVVYDSLPEHGKAALQRLAVVAPDRVPRSLAVDDDGEAVAELHDLGMVPDAREGLLNVHRVVQAHARGRSSEEETATALGAVVRALRRHIEGFDRHSKATWGRVGAVAAHIEAVSDRGGWPGDNDSFAARCGVMYDLADLYQCEARFKSGEGVYKVLEMQQRSRLGDKHPEVAQSLNNMATLYRAQGEYGKALPLLEEALRIRKASLGAEHPLVAQSLHNLAGLYAAQGEFGKAVPLLEEALRIGKAALGDEHPDVATTLNNLAGLYRSQGEYGKARPLYEEALRVSKATLGEEHPDVATTLNGLAQLYHAQGEYDKAVPLYEEALRIRKAALGEEHPDVATTLNNLAGLYRSQGEYDKAVPLYEEALRISKATLGEEHPDVALSLNNLAQLYHAQGESGKAVLLYEEALRIKKAALGDEHPSVATTLNNMAGLYKAQGEYGKALPLLEEALCISKAALGDEHPDVATTLNNLAAMYEAQGEYGKALPLYEEALRIRKAALGDEHPDVTTTLNGLAMMYGVQEDYGKAVPLYEEALRIAKATLGDEHPDVAALRGMKVQPKERATVRGNSRAAVVLHKLLAFKREMDRSTTSKGGRRSLGQWVQAEAGLSPKEAEAIEEADRVLLATLGNEKAAVKQLQSKFGDGAVAQTLAHLFKDLAHAAAVAKRLRDGDASEDDTNSALLDFDGALRVMAEHLGEAHADLALLHEARGLALARQGKLTDAADAFETACRLEKHAPVRNNASTLVPLLTRCAQALGQASPPRYEEALVRYAEALASMEDPACPDAVWIERKMAEAAFHLAEQKGWL